MSLTVGKSKLPVKVVERYSISSIDINIPGLDRQVTLRLSETDPRVFDKIFISEEYEHNLPMSPGLIVDAGANVGYSTLWFHRRYPDATIVAVEPDSANFSILQRNCGGIEKIILLNGALWPSNDKLSLSNTDKSWGVRTVPDKDKGNVRGYTVDSILSISGRSKIDIFKIDIEGAEKEIFESQDCSWVQKVGCIAIETHDRFKPGCSAAVRKRLGDRFCRSKKGENNFYYGSYAEGDESIWLVSDGRSGSTWLSNLLNYDHKFHEYFEPCHSKYEPTLRGEPLIKVGRQTEEGLGKYANLYENIFSGNYDNPRSGKKCDEKKPVLVKDIHSLLIANEIRKLHKNVRMICLYRNPVDVAKSKLSLPKWNWLRSPVDLLSQYNKSDSAFEMYREICESAKSQFQQYIGIWAIIYHGFTEEVGDDAIYVSYDSALNFPLDTFVRCRWGMPGCAEIDKDAFSDAFKTKSHTTRKIAESQKYSLTADDKQFVRRIKSLPLICNFSF